MRDRPWRETQNGVDVARTIQQILCREMVRMPIGSVKDGQALVGNAQAFAGKKLLKSLSDTFDIWDSWLHGLLIETELRLGIWTWQAPIESASKNT